MEKKKGSETWEWKEERIDQRRKGALKSKNEQVLLGIKINSGKNDVVKSQVIQ